MAFSLRCLVVAFLLSLTAASMGAEVSGYVALRSDYVKRGVSQSDSGPAAQLGIDFVFANGFFAGIWGSTTDIENGPTRRRDKETNVYAGYARDVSDTWSITGHVVAYRYPGQTGSVDYNYEEYSAGVSYDDRFWLEYSHTPDLYNTGESARNVDLHVELLATRHWAFGGGGGYNDTSDLTGSTYWYWHLGMTGSFRYADIDIRFHDTSRWVRIISSADRADSRGAITIRFPF